MKQYDPKTYARRKTIARKGDVVGYAASFLASISAAHAEPIANKRGAVVEVTSKRFVKVLWSGDAEPKLAHRQHIAKLGTAEFTGVSA